MKARQWNRKVTFRKLTAVSLGVMLALMSAGAQATVYESIDREGYDRVESDKVPIVITDDDVIFETDADDDQENIRLETASISISANRSLVIKSAGRQNLDLRAYYNIDFPDGLLPADLESKGTILISNIPSSPTESTVTRDSILISNTLLNINKDKTATQVTLAGDQSVALGSQETVYFTGQNSSYTGVAEAYSYQGEGESVLSFFFEPDEGSAATMIGMLRAVRYSTVNLTAESGTTITGVITSECQLRGDFGSVRNGNVNINLHGNAVLQRGDYTVPESETGNISGIRSETVGYSTGGHRNFHC